MEINIKSDVENALLNRREIEFSVEAESSTVSKEEIKKEICKKLNLSPESTIVVRVDQSFGSRQSSGVAHSYKSKEDLAKTEPKHILDRNAVKNDAPSTAAAEKPAEQPAKEEAKKE